ncbi:MAG: cyclically-permuted mutarotase family protein [Bacteroidaceae bacterium]|nr:cyclically-permuted mutarotase family protein [Bacteroidaceae bacterium]
MKRLPFISLLLSLSFLLLAPPLFSQEATSSRFNSATFTPLTPLASPTGEGLSGAFAGTFGEAIIVAGGCNFPDQPVYDGGQKRFYSEVYANTSPLTGGEWQQVGQLTSPVAYGASVNVPEGVVCIGGQNAEQGSMADVTLLSLQGKELKQQQLPPLPLPLDQMAATYGDGYIYVMSGLSHSVPSRLAFRLAWPNGTEWEQLPDVAGPQRVQAAAVMQRDSLGPCVYLMGGFDTKYGKTVDNVVRYDLRSKSWQYAGDINVGGQPMALVGATAVASGAAHIVCFGGVNKTIFEDALRIEAVKRDTACTQDEREHAAVEQYYYLTQPADFYRFNSTLLVYHTITQTWISIFQDPAMARAGATLVALKGGGGRPTWVIIGGEEKPGVRSTAVTAVKVDYTADFGLLNWIVLILYLLGMVYLGYYFMRRASNSTEDFFKGGGRIPWWAAGISIFATMLSAITYMSIPAKAYATDWTYYPMQICILVVSFPVIRYYLPFFRRLNVTTAYEYLERRFNYATRLMASLLFIVFMVARTALVLFLPSLAMTAVTGINIYICIALMALITIMYCTMGGVEAVVWGDVIQGIILVGGAVLAAVYLIVNTGENGASDFWQIATDHHKLRLFLIDTEHPFGWQNATWWVVILGGLCNNLISYTSDQTVIQRYLTTSDEKSAARGILTNGLMSVVVTIAFFTIGTGLYTFFKTHPEQLDITMAKGDAVFPFFMMSQLPAGLAGLLIAAVFAATMSTIASNINSISTAFTVDLWNKWKKDSNQGSVLTARIAGIVAGGIGMLIAMLMATIDIQSLLDYFNTILGLLSGAIGGLFMMGIFFPRIGSRAALIGFLAGTITVFYLNFCTDANFLLFGFASMLVSVVVAVILSYIWPQSTEQKGLTWSTLAKE